MTEATQPDPPTSTQLADFWDALNGPEEEPVAAQPADTLTLADVPGGEGAASLYLAQYHRRLVLWFKADDATHHFIRMEPGPEGLPHDRALWEHLTATVPRITKEDVP